MSMESTRPRDSERKTRIHLSLYDRSKFLLLFAIVFFVLVWADMAGDSALGFLDALNQTAGKRWWIFLLVGVEAVRQAHFLVAELAAPYHGFWQRYFAFTDRIIHKLSDWTRFRISRVIKWLLFICPRREIQDNWDRLSKRRIYFGD